MLYHRGLQIIDKVGKAPVIASVHAVATLLGMVLLKEVLGPGGYLEIDLVLASLALMGRPAGPRAAKAPSGAQKVEQ